MDRVSLVLRAGRFILVLLDGVEANDAFSVSCFRLLDEDKKAFA
jgi:hypothetical protein